MASQNFDRPWTETFKACKRVLKDLDWEVISADKVDGTIEAERGGNLLAFGHSLTVDVRVLKAGGVEVTANSSTLGPQVFDWGTNAKNENEFLDALSEILP